MKILYRTIFFTTFAMLSCLFLTRTVSAQAVVQSEKGEVLDKPVTAPSDSGLYKGINELPESVRRTAPFARALDEMVRRAGPSGTYDPEARVSAFEQSQQDLINSASAPAEKSLAPSGSSSNGQMRPLANAWTNIGLIGPPSDFVFTAGCTTTIAFDPTNPNVMYAGGTSGGVWKSTDAGAHWVSLTDTWIPNQSIASIAVDPKNHNTLYVGTGNGFASVDELSGTGLYRSTDGGGSWKHIGSSTIPGTVVKVLVDPVKSNVVFASMYSSALGASHGLYRSTDSGSTWTKVYSPTTSAVTEVWDIEAGTVVGGIPELYFAEGNNPNFASSECGLYRSGNDGATWSKIVGNLPAGDSIGRCSISISTAHPERVFVLMANPDGDLINELRSLFRSTDNGSTWTSIQVPSTLFIGPNPAAQGWYDCSVAVSPNSSSAGDTIFIGGIEAYYNYSDGNGWIDYSDNNNNGWSWVASHVDHHAIAFNPVSSKIVYDGCDGGLYWSQRTGDVIPYSYSSWEYRSNEMVTNRIYHMGLDLLDSKTTFVGLQDQGTWQLTDGTNSVLVASGDGMQPLSYSGNSQIPYYVELAGGDIYDNKGNPLYLQFTDNSYWDTPFKMAIVPFNGIQPYHVLYEGREHLWLSTDDGADWSMNGATFNDYIHSIGLSHSTSNLIYVGTTGEISVTTDGGTTWSSKTSGMPGAYVTSIVTTNKNTNFALASFYAYSGHRVMKTTNQGSTWVDASGTTGSALPQVGVSCVALDSASPLSTWYAATDNGIYYTMDTGAHWSVAGSGIGLAACSDVEVQANKTTIRVATFGRGIWEGNTGVLPIELASFTYQKQQSPQPVGTILNWITDSELGTAYFEIDRSIRGASFQQIAQVPTKASGGNSSVQLNYSFFDSTHAAGEYIYQLKEVDLDGSVHASNLVELNWGASGLIVSQNYPNPFLIGNPSTSVSIANELLGNPAPANTISPWPVTRFHYELPNADVVTLKIYTSTGELIRTILDQVQQQPGDPDAFWDGHKEDGSYAPSGTYFYVIQTQNSGTVVNKMILLSN
jgi:photosystem II stability/assembly factor-like uncharacterized protein